MNFKIAGGIILVVAAIVAALFFGGSDTINDITADNEVEIIASISPVPNVFSMKGALADSSGMPLTGTYSFAFYLYNAETEGSILWSEEHQVNVSEGVWNVTIGDVNKETTFDTLDFNSSLWIALQINGEMQSPRLNMDSLIATMITPENVDQARWR